MAEGGFSKVYLVRDAATRQPFALKQMLCQEKDAIREAYKEVEVLRAIDHRCVVALLEHASAASRTHPGAREFLLLFPFYARGTAWDAIVAATAAAGGGGGGGGASADGGGGSGGGGGGGGAWPFPEAAALRVFGDACAGCAALHRAGWAHRDMKPLNVLIDERGGGVVMDVGSAAPCRREVTSRQDALLLEDEANVHCSAPYRPPELMHINPGMVLDERVDVWALGCTLYALAFGRSPFESPRDGVLKLGIINGRFDFPRGNRNAAGCAYSAPFCGLISWMLNPDHTQRPHLPQVLERAARVLDAAER
ncbi:kinase-like domain-containing protein [Tribonema minus]|uniref:Kinase-like domain-containing protein n=1 Tax=Tribonema minus TaxID=303371 RepID=A0A835Z6A1_9STRA|nr:kinase-like domain-containing protein [Tribonema minus]